MQDEAADVHSQYDKLVQNIEAEISWKFNNGGEFFFSA